MPLTFDTRVNGKLVERLHVARLSGESVAPNAVNTYGVLKQFDCPTPQQWAEAPRFQHRYGDAHSKLYAEAVAALGGDAHE